MSLALKVLFPGTGQTKAMRFNMDIPIQQVIAEIKEKISFEGTDHGLFQQEQASKGIKARWLKENHTLKFYNLPQEAEVVFKKKTRPLKVRLVDNSTKTVLIDDTAKVQVIRDTIGKKLGIKSAEEYGLKVLDSETWLNPSVGLYEQEVKEDDTLVFDKNYFFFDDTIDRSDPVQLHLIYTKAVQSIIEGTYPVTVQQAVTLAGIQAQAVYSNYDPGKHISGFYPMHELIPAPQLKDKKIKPKQIEEMIITEHKKLVNTTDINAKYKYVQTVRQLPTYGITFYTVQIPAVDKKGRKKAGKMTDILVGITREKVLQMDYVSKEIIKEYPLTHLKRWAAVRGKFTFDFGDHEDEYWTVYTDRGAQISQLISGYIDIIINSRKQGVKQIEIEQRTGLATEEDIAVSGVAQTGYITNPGGRGGRQAPGGGVGGAGTNRPTAVEVTNVEGAMKVANLLREELDKPMDARTRSNTRRQSVVGAPQWIDEIVSYEKGTDDDIEKLVDRVMSGNVQPSEVDNVASSVASKLKNFVPLAKQLAAVGADEEAVNNAAKLVTETVADVLKNASAVARNPYDAKAKQLLQAAKQKYDAAMLLMKAAQANELNDSGTAELVKALAKAVDAAVSGLQWEADEFEKNLDGQNKTLIHNFGNQLGPANEGLQSAADILSSAVLNPNARKYVIDAGEFLGSLANQLEGVSRRIGASPEWLDRIGRSAANVNNALNLLVEALNTGEARGLEIEVDDAMQRVNNSVRALKDSAGNQKAMLQNIKDLASAANDVIRQALAVAKLSPPEIKSRLEGDCATLKTHLGELTEVGKEAIKNPNDPNLVEALSSTAQKVQDGVQALGGDLKNLTAAAALRAAAKAAYGRAIALSQGVQHGIFINAGEEGHGGSGLRVGDVAPPRVALRLEAQEMAAGLADMLAALKEASNNPFNVDAQSALVDKSKQLGPTIGKFVTNTLRGNNLFDPNQKTNIANNAGAAHEAFNKLIGAVSNAQSADSSGSDISSANKAMDANLAQISAAEFSAQADSLIAGDREGGVEILKQVAEEFAAAADSYTGAAQGSGPLSGPAIALTGSFGDLITSVEGIAGSFDKSLQQRMFDILKSLHSNTGDFLAAVKGLRVQKGQVSEDRVKQTRAAVDKDLGRIIGLVSGQDTGEIDAAIKAIKSDIGQLKATPAVSTTFDQAAKSLAQKNKALHAAAQQLAAMAQNNPKRVGASAKMVSTVAKNFVNAANTVAGAASEDATRKNVLTLSKTVLNDTVNVMENASNASLTGQMGALNDSVQRLGANVAMLEATLTGSSFPEIDSAVNSIFQRAVLIARPPAAAVGRPRREILRELDSTAAALAGNLAGLLSAARMGTAKVGIFAEETGNNVNKIIDTAVAAKAPLKVKSDVTLDPAIKDYIAACDTIISNPANAAAVSPATVKIGNLTKQLASNARDTAETLSANPERQKTYVNSAKALAAGVPKLVAAVKGGKAAVIAKGADFLKTTAQKMEAARQGVDFEVIAGGADGPVPENIAQDLSNAAQDIAQRGAAFLQASAQLASDPTNVLLATNLQTANDLLNDSLGQVGAIARALDPVKQSCQKTSMAIEEAIGELDVVLVNAGMGLLEKPTDVDQAQAKVQFVELLQSMSPEITTLRDKVGVDPREVQNAAERVALKFPQIVESVSKVAAFDPNVNSAKKLVSTTKSFAQSLNALFDEIKVGGTKTDAKAQESSEMLGALISTLKETEELMVELEGVVNKVRNMTNQVSEPGTASGKTYVQLKDALLNAARATTSAAAALNSGDKSNPGNLSMNAKSLARTLPALVNITKDAVATLPEPAAKERLTEATKELIESAADLIQASLDLAREDDLTNRAGLKEAWGEFSTAMPAFISAAKKGAAEENAIEEAAENISNIINRLNTLAIFASAGQELEGVKKTPIPYDQMVPKVTAGLEKLTSFAPNFAKARDLPPDQLAVAVTKFSQGMLGLTEASLSCADKASSNEAQQNILNATKAIALTAKQLILASRDVTNDKEDTMAQRTLDSSVAAFPVAAKVLTNVLSGVDDTPSVVSEQGGNPVERAIAGITNIGAIRAAASTSPSKLVETARGISSAATPLVFSVTENDVNEASNEALHAIVEFVSNVKAAAKDHPAVATGLQGEAKKVTDTMAALVDASSNLNRSDPGVADKITAASGMLNESLEGFVKVVNKMPGGSQLKLHSAEDIEKRTRKELNAAADYVRRVVSEIPRNRIDPNAQTEKAFLDAMGTYAHQIAEATASLIAASEAAETESRNRGDRKYNADPTWANGLISASHKVANGVGRLAEAVKKAAKGEMDEDDMIANAKHVAASVKQLYMASRTRQGVSASTQNNIAEASKSVARGTADLSESVRSLSNLRQENSRAAQSNFRGGVSSAIAQKLEQQAAILRLERQLEEARRGLLNMNKAEAQSNKKQ